jgi:hypothetical protein
MPWPVFPQVRALLCPDPTPTGPRGPRDLGWPRRSRRPDGGGNLGYDRPVVAIVLLPVVVFVWIARRLRIRREQHDLAERALAEAEAIRREQEIVDDLEARFNDA